MAVPLRRGGAIAHASLEPPEIPWASRPPKQDNAESSRSTQTEAPELPHSPPVPFRFPSKYPLFRSFVRC